MKKIIILLHIFLIISACDRATTKNPPPIHDTRQPIEIETDSLSTYPPNMKIVIPEDNVAELPDSVYFTDESLSEALIQYVHSIGYFAEEENSYYEQLKPLVNTTSSIELRDYAEPLYFNSWSKVVIPSIYGVINDIGAFIRFSYHEGNNKVYVGAIDFIDYEHFDIGIDTSENAAYEHIRNIDVTIPEITNPLQPAPFSKYKLTKIERYLTAFDRMCLLIAYEYPDSEAVLQLGNFNELDLDAFGYGHLTNGKSVLFNLSLKERPYKSAESLAIEFQLYDEAIHDWVIFDHLDELHNQDQYRYFISYYEKLFVENEPIAAHVCPSPSSYWAEEKNND